MPEIDDGLPNGPAGRRLIAATVNLSAAEALELLSGLMMWAEEANEERPDADWHMHITGRDGTELTIAVRPAAE